MVKKGTGKKDNKSSRFSFGSVIKYFRSSRGRMVFETCALLTFCAALLVSGSVSLAWASFNSSVRANTGSVAIKDQKTPEITLNVYSVSSISDQVFY